MIRSRCAWLVVLCCGCGLAESDVPGDDDGGPSEPTLSCANMDTILEPANEAIVETTMSVRVRWNASNVPVRTVSLNDDAGISYSPTSSEALSGGATRYTYELPAGGHFRFEMRWACHTSSGPETLTSGIRFHTQP